MVPGTGPGKGQQGEGKGGVPRTVFSFIAEPPEPAEWHLLTLWEQGKVLD